MRNTYFIASLLLSLFLFACGGKQGKSAEAGDVPALDSLHYATGFTVKAGEGYTLAEVINPWDSTKVLQRYILVNRDRALPANLPQGTIVRVPVKNVTVYSAVHVAIVDLLGEADKIIGVCESQYMNTTSIREGIKSGRIVDLGQTTSPNIEKIIDINTELIIASPFQNAGYGGVEKLGIPVIEGADYMENTPLGRAEWIRFYALLFDKVEHADSLFKATAARYNTLKELTRTVSHKPTLFSEKRYGSSWFVPAGESYMGRLYADAGGDYVFQHIAGAGSTPLSFESVLDQAIHADFWLLKYHDAKKMTYSDLRREYTPYENFDAFKNKTIYAANTSEVPYYEETPIHPDYLLEDLVKILHPELLPDYDLRYFHLLSE